jgi:hypothetical protein
LGMTAQPCCSAQRSSTCSNNTGCKRKQHCMHAQ